ncbi:MAG TPA: CotH kinase family protein [Vicinamibacteria bacterium]|nr:CotH kinase family protein [Vicinamibacteria bacterium]
MRERRPLLRRALFAAAAAALLAAPAGAQTYFNQSVMHEVRIVIDPADWTSLRENFMSNQYYAANISIDGQVVQQVGIRSRGKGSRSGTKPHLRVDFNRYVTGQELQGRKAIVLDNLIQDGSFLREALTYHAFEAVGLPAPKTAFTRVTVNDVYWGLYALTEEVSKPFLASRLGEDGGNLFKYEYVNPYDFSYLGPNPAAYVPVPFQPETNENTLDTSGLVEFIRTINEAPSATFTQTISAYLDVPRFLLYLAVENAAAENDGFVGYAGMNNLYLYQYAGQKRFVFIPWDKDNTFQSPTWPVMNRLDSNVLTRRLMEDPTQAALYRESVKQVAAVAVNSGVLGAKADELYTLIREHALTDDKKPFSNEDFEGSVGALKAIIAARQADVLSQVP